MFRELKITPNKEVGKEFTTLGNMYVVSPEIQFDFPSTDTIYIKVKNPNTFYSDVTVTMLEGDESRVSTIFSLKGNEMAVVPIPTGGATTCSILSTSEIYLVNIDSIDKGVAKEGFFPYSVNYSESVNRTYDASGMCFTMIPGSSVRVLLNQPADLYCIELMSNKPVHITRGRISYYIQCPIKLLVGAKFKQDLVIAAERVTVMRMKLEAVATMLAESSSSFRFVV